MSFEFEEKEEEENEGFHVQQGRKKVHMGNKGLEYIWELTVNTGYIGFRIPLGPIVIGYQVNA